MSVWGCVGKLGAGYLKHLDLGLARRMMRDAHAVKGSEGGAYGAATAFNKWSRGYRPEGGSTWKDSLARRATLYGGAAAGTAIGGGIAGSIFSSRKKKRMSNTVGGGSY